MTLFLILFYDTTYSYSLLLFSFLSLGVRLFTARYVKVPFFFFLFSAYYLFLVFTSFPYPSSLFSYIFFSLLRRHYQKICVHRHVGSGGVWFNKRCSSCYRCSLRFARASLFARSGMALTRGMVRRPRNGLGGGKSKGKRLVRTCQH